MKRYNHEGLPMPMVEDPNGYWVTYEDYNQHTLDCNKIVEKAWRANSDNREVRDKLHLDQIDSLRNIIVMLSIVVFGSFATIFFMW